MNAIEVSQVEKSIAEGSWKPNIYLSNISVAQFQAPDAFVAYKVFPVVPVTLPSSKFYKFDKGDLARSTMTEKPKFGTVTPTVWGNTEDGYSVKVYQGLWGIDQISASTMQRSGAPGMANPLVAKSKIAAEQSKLLMDLKFADKYFKPGAWSNQYSGIGTNPTGKQFYYFDSDNSNPIQFFQDRITDMELSGRRTPNKLSLGVKTFNALKNNKYILERVKYGGGSANPATVNEKVLAELFGIEQVLVLKSTYNSAAQGLDAKMEYICDEDGALLSYCPPSAAIDEPSAGYIFAWDLLGSGAQMAISNFLGANGTHSEFVEALCAFDMKQVSDDLGIYMTACVTPAAA